MKTFNRICIKEHTTKVSESKTHTLNRGEEYLTSKERNEKVIVFSSYWYPVPVSIFAGEKEFTK